MKKYRIITKEILVEDLCDQDEAQTIVQMYADQGVRAECETYNVITTEAKRMGRDPDLH
jgi:hypothetical protein|tara:strand:- start:210 stop:386 length:177 start_codon:yes stop_codon:yes gene_type:complete